MSSPVYLIEKSFLQPVISSLPSVFVHCRSPLPHPLLCFPMVDFSFAVFQESRALGFLPDPFLTPPPASQTSLQGSCGYKCPDRGPLWAFSLSADGPRVGGLCWGGFCSQWEPPPNWAVAKGRLFWSLALRVRGGGGRRLEDKGFQEGLIIDKYRRKSPQEDPRGHKPVP